VTNPIPHPIEKWYTGKALAAIRAFVLPTLAQAERDGYWPKGASRKVMAQLNKQAVAQRFAKWEDRDLNDRDLDQATGRLHDVNDVRPWWQAKLRGRDFVHAMEFGLVGQAPRLVTLGAALEPFCRNEAERAALTTARGWAADFAPIAELVELLDSRRPPITIVLGSLSPTVAANLGRSLGIRFDSISIPPTRWVWEKVKMRGKDGKPVEVQVQVGYIDWPEGTEHNRSRFAYGSRAGNMQCHACGHAIQDPYNWVPLLAERPVDDQAHRLVEAQAHKLALWVGRDCARKLFNVDIKGDSKFVQEAH